MRLRGRNGGSATYLAGLIAKTLGAIDIFSLTELGMIAFSKSLC
jgi:hypothetical protein